MGRNLTRWEIETASVSGLSEARVALAPSMLGGSPRAFWRHMRMLAGGFVIAVQEYVCSLRRSRLGKAVSMRCPMQPSRRSGGGRVRQFRGVATAALRRPGSDWVACACCPRAGFRPAIDGRPALPSGCLPVSHRSRSIRVPGPIRKQVCLHSDHAHQAGTRSGH